MGIFGRNKIRELKNKIGNLESENITLEETIRNLTSENMNLKEDLTRANSQIAELTTFKNTTPTDCIPGEYCIACEFGKVYRYAARGIWRKAYRCGKAEFCVNFIQKREVD